MERTASVRAHRCSRVVAAATTLAACLLALSDVGTAGAQPSSPSSAGAVTAALEQCVPASVQSERSATFMGEMTTVPGTAKMSMRIDVEERAPEELEFHALTAPGLGVWRSSEPKVKTYKYLKQVTNLSAPASYRALVRFRWFNAKGHMIKRAERLTSRCLQPAVETVEPLAPEVAGGSAAPGSSTSTPAA